MSTLEIPLLETSIYEYGSFYYLPTLRVLICTACRQALILVRLDAHLRIQHSLQKKERTPILEWAKAAPEPGVIASEEELRTTTFPRVLSPILGLGIPRRDGLKCIFAPRECSYISPARKSLLNHLRGFHNWVNTARPRGKPSSIPGSISTPYQGLWLENIPYIKLFPSGLYSGFFEVSVPEVLPSAPNNTTISITTSSSITELVQQFEAPSKEVRDLELNQIRKRGDFLETNAWLVRLGATAHLAAFSGRKAYLRELISLPGGFIRPTEEVIPSSEPNNRFLTPEEATRESLLITVIFGAFDRVLYDGRQSLRPTVVSNSLLFELGRKNTSTEPRKPFVFYHRKDTIRGYAEVYKRFFAYTLRTIKRPADDRPPYRPIETLLRAWDTLLEEVNRFLVKNPEYKYNSKNFLLAPAREEPSDRAFSSVINALLGFIIEVFRQPLYRSEYDSILVSFLGILALRADYTWETPYSYTRNLSAVTTLFKVVLYGYLSRLRTSRIEARVRDGAREDEADYEEPSITELVTENQALYLLESSLIRLEPNCFRWAVKLRKYGRTISANTPRPGLIRWEGDTVFYKEIRLDISHLRATIFFILKRARKTLFLSLLYSKSFNEDEIVLDIKPKPDIPAIPWLEIADDFTNSEPGFSFASFLRELLPASRSYIFQRIIGSEISKEWFSTTTTTSSTTSSSLVSNPTTILIPSLKALKEYGATIERLLEDLAFLAHLTSGQASRGTELLSLRLRNTPEGGLRNVFFDRGLIVLITGYHKGYNESGYTKVIHRFLPKIVSELFIYYIWLVNPFWEDIIAFSKKDSSDPISFSPYIWPPDSTTLERSITTKEGSLLYRKPWNTLRLSRSLIESFSYSSGPRIGVSEWRHFNKAITRKYLRKIDLEDSYTTSKSTSSKTVEKAYTSDLSSSESDSESEAEKESTVWNAQAGHSGQTSRNIYGRLLGEGVFESSEFRATFRKISLLWHDFLGFPTSEISSSIPLQLPTTSTTSGTPSSSISKGSRGRKRRSSTLNNTTQINRAREARLEVLKRVDLLTTLREMYGPTTTFRGRQEEGLQAIIEGRNPILIIRPTGSGKSLAFLLPAYVSTGISLVIVPLISLQEDLYKRATVLRIPSIIWRPTEVFTTARLVFTTPESCF
jgi:hypothetical protein